MPLQNITDSYSNNYSLIISLFHNNPKSTSSNMSDKHDDK